MQALDDATLELIRSRRTIGRAHGELTRTELLELIEAAVWAPCHKMTESWSFTVVDGDARRTLGEAWGARASRDADADKREAIRAGEAGKLLRAPHVIVVSTSTSDDDVRAEEDFAATSAGVQNMLLLAHARGYGAGWKTGKIAHDPEIKELLGLAPDDRIVGLVYVGRHAESIPAARPRTLEARVRWMDSSSA